MRAWTSSLSLLVAVLLSATGCAADGGDVDGGDAPSRNDATQSTDGDRGTDTLVTDAADVSTDTPVMPRPGIAPAGAAPGGTMASDGANALPTRTATDVVLRIDANAREHIGFHLTFAPAPEDVVLVLERWNGERAVELGRTDGGSGLRTLAALDSNGERTFWVRVQGLANVTSASLNVTHTPFEEGSRCLLDCERLLQLPLPNDVATDGYTTDGSTVFRYQFGRRDMLMFLRYAGREMVRAGLPAFIPQDLSQWDGLTPGSDTGGLRHASHQRGKDVDISLYGSDGRNLWRSYCMAVNNGDGRECVNGSARNFDGEANARMFAAFFESGRVTMSFLDTELIEVLRPGAMRAVSAGQIDSELLPLFNNGRHVQHWPNHDNHVHIRISESATAGTAFEWHSEPFEAP